MSTRRFRYQVCKYQRLPPFLYCVPFSCRGDSTSGAKGACRSIVALTEGLLDFLASGSSEAMELLRQYVVHVVPVLNPDGAWD